MTIITIEVARLNANFRVVSLHDGPARAEWVLQRHVEGQWCCLSYARIKPSLLSIVRRWAGHVDPAAQEILDALPTHVGEWSRKKENARHCE